MDFAVDVRLLLTIFLLIVMLGALWAWARTPTVPSSAAHDALSAVFGNAPVAVLWLDAGGEVQMANTQARALTGMDAKSTQLPASEWRARLLQDVQAVLASPTGSGRSRTINIPSPTESAQASTARNSTRQEIAPGQQTWQWWVTAWQGRGLVFVNDVTAAQQAEQATHLLLSDLAHELRTPLATLATHLEVLRLATVAPEIREQSVQFLRDETQRLVRLVYNTLELGRLQSSDLERRPVQLHPLVESVVAQLHADALAKAVEVSLESGGNLPIVLGNADRLKQLWLNLLDNSIKYARSGDRVMVKLAAEAGGIACSVCDTGPGIAAEHLPHVTRRFYRAVPSGLPGSGLGLALAAEIVRQHGAQLAVESRSTGESTGTCVRFVLPAWANGEGA